MSYQTFAMVRSRINFIQYMKITLFSILQFSKAWVKFLKYISNSQLFTLLEGKNVYVALKQRKNPNSFLSM